MLKRQYDKPRPSGALELSVGLAPFASGCVLHGGCGAGIRARPRGASSGDRADDRGVDRELGAVPQRQAVGDYLDATCISDRYIDVHVANPTERSGPLVLRPRDRREQQHAPAEELGRQESRRWRRPSDGRQVGLGVRGRSTCAEHEVRGGGGAGAAARGVAPTARQRQGR